MRYPLPKQYPITQKFNEPNAALTGGLHKGTDYGCPENTNVMAIMDGEVVESAYQQQRGHYVAVQSGQYKHLYYHLNNRAVGVGAKVSAGQSIGLSGATGLVTGPHLHLQLEKKGVPVDFEVERHKASSKQPQGPSNAKDGETYIIQPGDTFWGLEERRNIPHGTLQKLNPHLNPRRLRIGQEIRISGSQKSNSAPAKQFYVIRPGDTFWALENAWQMPHGTLQRLNPGVEPRKLQIGQRIRKS